MRHLIDPLDFTLEETTKVLDLQTALQKIRKCTAMWQMGKRLPLFFMSKYRTCLSFESAMLSLGGKAFGFAGAEQSSAKRRNGSGYCPVVLLCRYHCNAPSQGRCTPSRIHVRHSTCYQCR